MPLAALQPGAPVEDATNPALVFTPPARDRNANQADELRQPQVRTAVLHTPEPPARRRGIFTAALLPAGVSLVGDGASARELTVRLDAELADGHSLSLIGGNSPVRADRSPGPALSINMSVAGGDPPSASGRTAEEGRSPRPRIGDEMWVGAGYTITAISTEAFDLGGGPAVGYGTHSLRYGGEVRLRYHVSEVVALQGVASAMRVVPIDDSRQLLLRDDGPGKGLYFEWEQAAEFTAVGAQVGISVNLGGSR